MSLGRPRVVEGDVQALRLYSEALLRAEQRLLDAALTHTGPVVHTAVRDRAIRRFEAAKGLTLNPGQRALVKHFVSTGTALAVAIGPPGTGKSTVMGAVRDAWETTGGRVIGLAPSAAAASVLGDELGVPADSIHRLLHAHTNNQPLDIRRGDMLLVDEAGMAGTRLLDEVHQLAVDRGAVARVIGDYRQLYAKVIDGQDDIARDRIAKALGCGETAGQTSSSAGVQRGWTAADGRFGPDTAGQGKISQ